MTPSVEDRLSAAFAALAGQVVTLQPADLPAARHRRPWVVPAAAAAAVVVLVGGAVGVASHVHSGSTSPADSPAVRLEPAAPLDEDQLQDAARLLGRRLAADHQRLAQVKVVDDHLEVTGAHDLAGLAVRGELEVRQVLQAVTPADSAPLSRPDLRLRGEGSGSAYTPSGFTLLTCAPVDVSDEPALARQRQVACESDGSAKYELDRAALTSDDVRSASIGEDQTTGAPQVNVSFTALGQQQFTDLTKRAYALLTSDPTMNRIAVTLDGVVVAAPSINSVITGGAQISGGFTRQQAEQLVAVLDSGPLPAGFRVAG